jgi:histidinol-phosphate aminotransferase
MPSSARRLDDARLFPYTPDLPASDRSAQAGLPIARLDANETHLGPFPGSIEAAQRAVERAHRYPEHGAQLLERVAALHGVREGSIVFGNGADALIGCLAAGFLEPGDEAVMAAPSFVSYLQDTLRAGGRPVEVPVRADGALDLPAMAAAVTARTRLIFVCNPNNPTGGVLGRAEIEAFLETVPTTVLVVLDEAYAEYVEPSADIGGPSLAAARPNVAVLRTFSKIFGLAGLRIGYLIGPEPVVGAVRRLRHWFDVTDVAHLAAFACLDDPAEVARRAEVTRGARARLAAIMTRHGLATMPSEASFVAARVPDGTALAASLAARGVLVRTVGDPAGDLVRISAGSDEDLALLDSALGIAGG